ncbi:hypothetical protein CGCSCA5_v009169 [Colletotrichum siamense]|nr:hypothetical protein CGCSCA5_v009169 [Colletotrichum siamense]
MAELAQFPQPLRPPARAHRRRYHRNLYEPDRTNDRWNPDVVSYTQQQQSDTHLLYTNFDILALLWIRNRRLPESLPSFAQNAFGGIPQMAFANRFLGHSNPELQRPLPPPPPPPSRAEEPSRETLPEMGESNPKDDTAGQPQTTGIRLLAHHPSHPGDLCGLYEVVDLERRIRELRDEVSRFVAIASEQDYEDDSDDYMNIMRCCFDEDRWQCWHGESCSGFWGNENADSYEYFGCSYTRTYCGLEEQMGRLEEISKLEAAALWSATLETPILAAGNSLFPAGLLKSPKFVATLLSSLLSARFPPYAVIANQLLPGLSTKIFVERVGLATSVD